MLAESIESISSSSGRSHKSDSFRQENKVNGVLKRESGSVNNKKGFTLIELLVVISIIALLLSILMPALNIAKKKASAVVCMVNTKNLSLGWFMYQEDNNGRIMSALMNGQEKAGGPIVGWIGTPRDEAGFYSDIAGATPVTDEDEIRGIEKGAMYPYVKDPDVYSCVGDKVKSIYDGTEKLVTYAIPRCLYGFPNEPDNNSQIKKYSEIRMPAQRYAFVETAEARNFIAGGSFVMAAPEYTGRDEWGWWGPMAINHAGNSILGFCDGHAESHKWRDSFTKDRLENLMNGGGYGQQNPPDGQTADLEYMARGWPYRYSK